MNIPCPNPPVPCFDPANPLMGFSSETDDKQIFVSEAWSLGFPPLGSEWVVYPCFGQAESTVSQEDADFAAARDVIACEANGRAVFTNSPQTCQGECPDGLPFFYTVAAGTFAAFSQLMADRMAFTYACKQLSKHKVCLSAMDVGEYCFGGSIASNITATGNHPPFAFAVESGSIPSGTSLHTISGTKCVISGTPSSPGVYVFTLRVEDSIGGFMTKQYVLRIVGITNSSPLPDATNGTAYSVILAQSGATSVTWSIISGVLPNGLSLNSSTGEIYGTPTTNQTQPFTIQITDGVVSCSKALSITVKAAGVDCLPPSSFPTIAVGSSSDEAKYVSSTNTIWTPDNVDLKIYVCDLLTDAVIHTIDVTAEFGTWDIAYDPVNDQMVVMHPDLSVSFYDAHTYAQTNVPNVVTVVNGYPIAVDTTRGNILFVDVEKGFGISNIRLFSGATKAQIAANDQPVSMECPVYVSSTDKFYIGKKSVCDIFTLHPTTLALTDLSQPLPLAGDNQYPYFGLYISSLDQICWRTKANVNQNSGLFMYNVAAGTWSSQLVGPDINPYPFAQFSVDAMSYNDCTGIIYATDFAFVWRFDPITGEIGRDAQVNCWGIDFVHAQNLTWVRLDTQLISM